MKNALLKIIESIKRATGDLFLSVLVILALIGFFFFVSAQLVFIMDFIKTGSLSLALETSLFLFRGFGYAVIFVTIIFLNLSVILLLFDYLNERYQKREARDNPLPEQKNGQ
jgi:hypothetical protein